MQQFTLEYWRDDDWYVGRLIEIPGVFSQGETLDEALVNTKQAIESHILALREDEQEIPVENSPVLGRVKVAI